MFSCHFVMDFISVWGAGGRSFKQLLPSPETLLPSQILKKNTKENNKSNSPPQNIFIRKPKFIVFVTVKSNLKPDQSSEASCIQVANKSLKIMEYLLKKPESLETFIQYRPLFLERCHLFYS